MKRKIISFAAIAIMLLGGAPSANAQFLQNICRALGVKEDSYVMSICKVGDEIGNAAIAKQTDNAINKYGSAEANSYKEWADNWNTEQEKKLTSFNNEREQYMKDYCKQHGFYELWLGMYGDNWFEMAGREWFEKQNDLRIRRGEDELLPWHLRGNAEEVTRYSPVESNLCSAILNDIGLSSNDLDRANQWIESDKYGKQDMIIDAAFNVIGNHVDNTEMLEGFRQLAKANNKYLKNIDNQNPYAVTERNIDFQNIIFNAASISHEKKANLLAEKRKICQSLMNSGAYTNEPLALEVAGQVLSIQKDKTLSETEKKEWLCQLGYYEKVEEILEAADKINNSIEPTNVEPEGPTPEEIEEQKRKEQEEKERIERENAITAINNTSIQKYKFDSSDLTDIQKTSLDEIAEIMNKYNDLSLTITGHTCSKGYKSVNQRIGLRRANIAKEYLINKGIDENRIVTKSMGEEAPIVENFPIENRSINRRLEFAVE